MNGEIDLADGEFNSITCGFYWGTSEEALDTYLEGGEIIDGVYSASLTGLSPETQYWYKAYAELDDKTLSGEVKSFKTNPIPEGAVDLGIVMTREDGTTYNLYWAKSNLGEDGFVNSPEEYGAYYAWGETTTKSDYSWSTYKFGTSSSGPFSKYNTSSSYGTVDNKTVLETGPDGDDVASMLLDGNWRMPTDAEWVELRAKCTWTWNTQNGVNGMLVTAPNGNHIFLPAAGNWGDRLYLVGDGDYWSSSLSAGVPCNAYSMDFNSIVAVLNSYFGRKCGFSVRPVYEE